MQPQTSQAAQLKSTQNSLLISEVKDGVVILRDGSIRAVVLASAINFDLMSRQEQDSVEYAYQGFLNSLHFPIQIVIRSQKVSLDSYLEDLHQKQAGQDNELLSMLMEDYIANIQALIEEVNIMRKQFYVVIPYFPPVITKDGFFSSLSGIFKGTSMTTVQEADFNAFKTELSQRVALVASGLNQMGIRAIPLNTQELIDLYYSAYNPDVAINQKLIEASQIQSPLVTRSDAPLPSAPVVAAPEPVEAIEQPAPPPAPVPEPVPAPAPAPVAPQPVAVAPQPAPVPEPATAMPIPQAVPIAPPPPSAPTPQVSQMPAVNPTGFDPYSLALPATPPPPAPLPAQPTDNLAAEATAAVAATVPTPPSGGAQ